MVFKSDKQRKKVMAMLTGGTVSAVSPQIIDRKILVQSQQIPALTGTLGRAQPAKDAKAFRVWVHPSAGGDDSFFEFADLKRAKRFRERMLSNPKYDDVEPVIGVFRKDLKKFPKQKWWEARLKGEKHNKHVKKTRGGIIDKAPITTRPSSHNTHNDISKSEFQSFVRVRDSGVTNMFDTRAVSQFSGLDKEKIIKIMKNFNSLSRKFPGVVR